MLRNGLLYALLDAGQLAKWDPWKCRRLSSLVLLNTDKQITAVLIRKRTEAFGKAGSIRGSALVLNIPPLSHISEDSEVPRCEILERPGEWVEPEMLHGSRK